MLEVLRRGGTGHSYPPIPTGPVSADEWDFLLGTDGAGLMCRAGNLLGGVGRSHLLRWLI